MLLIKGIGNGEIIAWCIGCVVLCHLVALPFTHLFELAHDWRVPKGGKYADYEKLIEKSNGPLKSAFNQLYLATVKYGENRPFDLPYFTPEVYCPLLLSAGGRKLCAPWLFDKKIKQNRIDVEKLKETGKVVEIPNIHKDSETRNEFETTATCAYSMHPGRHSVEDDEWREAIPGCKHETTDGVALPSETIHVLYAGVFEEGPKFDADTVVGARVCQLVVDMRTNSAASVKDLRTYGEAGYRIMNYEKIADHTARFSFIQGNCTDHFGVKYIKKYLV